MTETVTSQNGAHVRLTDERWAHITEEHCELAGMHPEVLETIVHPSHIYEGNGGELLAVREIEPGKYLVAATARREKTDSSSQPF